MEHEQREACKLRFEDIEKWRDRTDERLKDGDGKMESQGNTIVAMSTDMRHLTEAMSKLTAALWGMVIAVAGTGIGFVIWYIQNTH